MHFLVFGFGFGVWSMGIGLVHKWRCGKNRGPKAWRWKNWVIVRGLERMAPEIEVQECKYNLVCRKC